MKLPVIATSSKASVASGRVEVFKDFTLHACHRVGTFPEGHPCRNMHGHTYHVRVVVGGPVPVDTGLLVPFEDIRTAWDLTGAKLDHGCLNDTLGEMATCELLAVYLIAQLAHHLPGIVRVEVNETGTAGAIAHA